MCSCLVTHHPSAGAAEDSVLLSWEERSPSILIRFLSDRPSLKETLYFLLNEEEGYADKRTDLMERDDTRLQFCCCSFLPQLTVKDSRFNILQKEASEGAWVVTFLFCSGDSPLAAWLLTSAPVVSAETVSENNLLFKSNMSFIPLAFIEQEMTC